ncbi:hypothetical protein C5Y93_19740 [Blastopirellula marina]|uniref:Uncharacterized protein n=1 Tax=Blastopirellula marina TaxID=124 RepID=A0A2S8GID9_9BACT|nr:hypothetical protein C5Y93_19740 [Blastopirellula marina]
MANVGDHCQVCNPASAVDSGWLIVTKTTVICTTAKSYLRCRACGAIAGTTTRPATEFEIAKWAHKKVASRSDDPNGVRRN